MPDEILTLKRTAFDPWIDAQPRGGESYGGLVDGR